MRLWDRLLGTSTAQHDTPAVPKPEITLQAAPNFLPHPEAAGQLDAALMDAWLQFQQSNPGAGYERFITALKTQNDQLKAEISRLTEELQYYR